jgi:hypothetical protein
MAFSTENGVFRGATVPVRESHPMPQVAQRHEAESTGEGIEMSHSEHLQMAPQLHASRFEGLIVGSAGITGAGTPRREVASLFNIFFIGSHWGGNRP